MQRQPRRMKAHPRYQSGMRMGAAEIRRARQNSRNGDPAGVKAAPARAVPAGARNPQVRPYINSKPQAQPAAPRRRWSRKRMALVGFPAVILALLAVIIVPVLYEARQAYDDIFAPSNDRPVVGTDEEGNPIIVNAADATSEPNSGDEVTVPGWEGTDRVNILLLGVDDRDDDDGSRSDTMIIVSIDPTTKQVGMLSIPRDLWVQIPDYGQNKINAAYPLGAMRQDLGGPELARATVEWNFKIPIHYYAEIDFTGFEKIVDTIGGLVIDVPAPIKDDQYPGEKSNYTRIYFHTGLQHMSGETALRYSRTRHDDNDFARGDRQQQILRAMREQGVKLDLITKAAQLIDDFGDTFRTDLSPRESLGLARLGTEISGENIQSYNLLSAISEYASPEIYYLNPNWSAVNDIMDEMMHGRPQSTPGTAGSSTPEATAVPQPVDYSASIMIQNATTVNRLAGNAADQLSNQGFMDVEASQSSETGTYPRSVIIDYSGNLATTQELADILGLPRSAIRQETPSDSPGYDIIVILGEDAPVAGGL